ncbi:MAG TPA: thiamine pyrophosphate-binding protein, partial [Chitinophagales bacterium]|nr:thiamine pyrophosphate-binding protein [Chitinophagales bacterium]
MNGGQIIANVLQKQGVRYLFTLCGGHISPIFVAAEQLGIRVIDTRHEVNAVFAADAVSRLTGVPGVAAVTAGPGVTNTITAVKNAALAQSPLVLLGGAAATILKGRGSLQDIDQLSIMKAVCKWSATITKVKDIVPVLEQAFWRAQEGVPGPVFVECPIDTLYDEELVRSWYGAKSKETPPKNMQER